MTDLYDTLGVKRDATDAEIKAAAKAHARQHHPDKGGNAEEFHNGRRALAVLSDHAKRGKYDKTGEIDNDNPDNRMAEARGIIDRCVGEAVASYLAAEDPTLDPRMLDLIDIIKTVIRSQIATTEKEIKKLDRQHKFFADFTRRFRMKKKAKTDFDFLKRRFDDELRKAAASRKSLEEMITVRKMAIDIISDYSFDWGMQ